MRVGRHFSTSFFRTRYFVLRVIFSTNILRHRRTAYARRNRLLTIPYTQASYGFRFSLHPNSFLALYYRTKQHNTCHPFWMHIRYRHTCLTNTKSRQLWTCVSHFDPFYPRVNVLQYRQTIYIYKMNKYTYIYI